MNINEYNQTLENNYTTIKKVDIEKLFEKMKNEYIENKLSVVHLKKCLYPNTYYEYFNLLENKFKLNNCNDIENILTIFYFHLKNNVKIVSIDNKSLKALNLLFLTKKLESEIFYISRFNIEFVVFSLLNQDNKDNIIIFKNNQDKNNILNIINKEERKEKKDLIRSCNNINKFSDLSSIESYQELYNTKAINPIKKESIRDFWKIRKDNKLNTKENKDLIKLHKVRYRNKYLINEIKESLLSYYTNNDIIDLFINYYNIESVISDLSIDISHLKNDIDNINNDIFKLENKKDFLKLTLSLNIKFNYFNHIIESEKKELKQINKKLESLSSQKENKKYLLSLIIDLFQDLKENKQLILEKKEKLKDIEIIESDYY